MTKILITRPAVDDPGGVTNYYTALEKYFSIGVTYFIIGRRTAMMGPVSNFFRLIKDYIYYIKEVGRGSYDLVHINPSLNMKGIIRDGVFILLGRFFRKKVIVFFRGWDSRFERVLEKYLLWLFYAVYDNADAFILLGDDFKRTMQKWGFRQPMYIETTVISDDTLRPFDVRNAIKKRSEGRRFKVLFLARLVREKGMYEAVDSVSLLQKKYDNIDLIIAGDGKDLEEIKEYVKMKNISNVFFPGYVVGAAKINLYEEASVYFLPTYYQEGMPNSVVEAMAFGLPVVTRPVGGIKDFFKNGKTGFFTESKDPRAFSDYIEKLYLDKGLRETMSFFNHNYAQERFMASKVAKRLEGIYSDVLQHQDKDRVV